MDLNNRDDVSTSPVSHTTHNMPPFVFWLVLQLWHDIRLDDLSHTDVAVPIFSFCFSDNIPDTADVLLQDGISCAPNFSSYLVHGTTRGWPSSVPYPVCSSSLYAPDSIPANIPGPVPYRDRPFSVPLSALLHAGQRRYARLLFHLRNLLYSSHTRPHFLLHKPQYSSSQSISTITERFMVSPPGQARVVRLHRREISLTRSRKIECTEARLHPVSIPSDRVDRPPRSTKCWREFRNSRFDPTSTEHKSTP